MAQRTVFITGANRGIGLSLAEHYVQRGDIVFATARQPKTSKKLLSLRERFPKTLLIVQLDVTDDLSIQKAFEDVRRDASSIDIFYNNAGRYGDRTSRLDTNVDDVRLTIETNAIAPFRISQVFVPLILKSAEKKLVQITSLVGSIEDNSSGGSYGYRMSKAAINMLAKTIAVDFSRDQLICVAIHPGWVKTDMGGSSAPMEVEASAQKIIETVDHLSMKDSGAFLRYDGKVLPY